MSILNKLSRIAILSLFSFAIFTPMAAISAPDGPNCSRGTPLYSINALRNHHLFFSRHRGTETGMAPLVDISDDRIWRFGDNGFFAGDNGAIYQIELDGALYFSQHAGRDSGAAIWPVIGRRVGSGWGNFVKVFSGEQGAIYAIRQNGDLLYYQHQVYDDGSSRWAVKAKKVGHGWAAFRHVFAGSEGAIYAIKNNGDLLYYRHDGYADGSAKWPIQARKIGNGWNAFWKVFAGSNGAIYAIRGYGSDDEPLLFYKHDGYRDGSARWSITGKEIATGHWTSSGGPFAPVTSCP